MSITVPKYLRNKTSEEVEALRRIKREDKADQRSIKSRMRAALHDIERNNKDYVVVKKILKPMAESTYRKWLEKKHSVPLKKDFTAIQPRHGRKYFELCSKSPYRQNMYPKLDELELAMKDLYKPKEGWQHTTKYLLSEPGTQAQGLHTDYQDGKRFVVFGGMELESCLLVFNKDTKKLEKVTYYRGDVVIIKRDSIHAGWYNNTGDHHYRIFIDIGNLPLAQAGYKNLTFFSVKDLKEMYGAPENVAEGLGPVEMLGPLLE